MNYELAKKLRDAGFPMTKSVWQAGMGMFIGDLPFNEQGYLTCESIDRVRIVEEKDIGVECYPSAPNPTLEELIEACGGILLWGCKDHNYYASKQFCSVENPTIESMIEADAEGKTPEEAVANLWLELNKK